MRPKVAAAKIFNIFESLLKIETFPFCHAECILAVVVSSLLSARDIHLTDFSIGT